MEHQYNNAWFDGSRREARLARKALEAETDPDVIKANALMAMANKPANKINPVLIVIPVVVLIVGGVIAMKMIKK